MHIVKIIALKNAGMLLKYYFEKNNKQLRICSLSIGDTKKQYLANLYNKLMAVVLNNYKLKAPLKTCPNIHLLPYINTHLHNNSPFPNFLQNSCLEWTGQILGIPA